jgi:hypothetical protein
MSKSVLFEQVSPTEAKVMSESSNDGKTMYLSGIMLQAELKNRNGRLYPLAEIAKATATINEQIKSGYSIMGELEHPESLSINLDRVSHIITEMKMSGNNAVGKAKILDTPCGNIVKALINGGAKLGVSSRGTGDVNESTVSNYLVTTVDIVANPSAPSAYPNAVYESTQDSKILTLAEAVILDKSAQKYLQAEVNKFLESIFQR